MSKRVMVITPFIKPGGGPPGYVYNLMKGIEELSSEDELQNDFHFFGEQSIGRYKATGEKSAAHKSVRAYLVQLATTLGLKPLLSKKIRDAKKAIRASDLVVFQGYQEAYLVGFAKKIGKQTAYMPHSPSVMANEYKMLCGLNGKLCCDAEYNRLHENEKKIIILVNHILFPSQGARGEYDNAFSDILARKKCFYIKSGASIEANIIKSEPLPRNADDPVKVFFVGRYVYHKGYDLFCDAAEIVCKNSIDAEFYTVGDGPMNIESPHVTNLGWRNDVLEILKMADIVVVPNRIAYYDLLPLECAALGKPLVMTAVGGNVDQLTDLSDSIVCNKPDADSLADSIKEAVTYFKSTPFWGLRNQQSYYKTFCPKEFARRWDLAIGKMVGTA